MDYTLERVEPQSARDEIVRFFWELRHWPWSTLEEYHAAWDWRYSSLSDGESWVWVARKGSTGEILGHVALHARRYRVGGSLLRVGVPGNLLVHPEHRGSLLGPRLVSFPRTLVRAGELDAVIAFANPMAHGMFERLGFRDLGLMHPFIQVRSWRAVAGRRLALAAPLGALVDGALAVVRRQRLERVRATAGVLRIRRLTPEEFLALDRSHWGHRPDGLSTADSGGYVIRRYLQCPYARRQLIGLLDGETGKLEGYVVAGGERRVRIWDCQVNPETLDEGTAIQGGAAAIPATETVVVPTLPGSDLARKLSAAGFRRREPDDYMSQTTRISAYWLDGHPAAPALAKVEGWNLWFGANHY